MKQLLPLHNILPLSTEASSLFVSGRVSFVEDSHGSKKRISRLVKLGRLGFDLLLRLPEDGTSIEPRLGGIPCEAPGRVGDTEG